MTATTTQAVSRTSRVRGCLLGGAIGDALGAGIEFASLERIRATYGAAGVTGYAPAYGQANAITDDTQLSMFTVEALLTPGGEQDLPARLWRQYLAWASHQRSGRADRGAARSRLEDYASMTAVRAPGNACLSGLASPRMGTVCRPANPNSKGCGTVMRSAPFGLAARTPEQAWQQAIAGAVLTHGHPSGYLSAAALAWIIRLLADGYPLSEAVHSALDRLDQHGPDAAETSAALAAALDLAAAGPLAAETLQSLGGGWTGEEALAIAVYAALVHTRPEGGADTRAALLDSVNHSGDSDSTGAICGNLLGAAHGLHALPAEWVDTVEAGALVLQSADQLAAQAPPHR